MTPVTPHDHQRAGSARDSSHEAPGPEQPSPRAWGVWCAVALPVVAAIVGLILVLNANRGEATFEFSQATPEEVMASAKQMVIDGRADLLTELIWAEDESMRGLYRHLGGVMGSLQGVALAAARAYPDDIERVRNAAIEAAENGRSTNIFARAVGGARQRRSASRFSQSDDPLNDVLQTILANPYGWLESNVDRLTTQTISDDMVALMWDNKPIFPPMGVILQLKDDQKWYLVLPTHLPMVKGVLPKTEDEYQVWASVLMVFERAFDDLRDDIESGKIRNLDRAAEEAGKKVVVPAMLTFFALGKVYEARKDDG